MNTPACYGVQDETLRRREKPGSLMITHDVLDLRNLPIWERASTVLEVSDKLGTGSYLDFFTEVDPRALIARIEQLHPAEFTFEPRHLGGSEWRVRITRSHYDPQASTLASAFRRSPVFSALDENARAHLIESTGEHNARKGQVVCAENSACTYLGVLIDGAMAVFVGAGSRERLLYHVVPFDTFGETEFFDGGLTLGRTVVLSKAARYATIPFDVLRDAAMRSPSFMMMLAAASSQNNRTLASELAAQVSQPIIARVAAALLPYAAPERGLHPALPPLPTMTQAQIAAAAGTVKEVAARAIAELERVQALRRERGHIRFLDRSKLLSTIDQAS